ncbi:ATPase [candidate division WWE3 bacterium RIFOXYD1_FULL_39_9]|uniref:ATPase n=1 Tax=candidate division WWE3 bacterium RIFOXYD1_FULL_39_9 TaxID=1802649 RepID=A0A1F4X6E1_UNCKA|nr:MAG: ATPase [candidate division WWE3 bacterium RIFOXYD1_FULL_39_9]
MKPSQVIDSLSALIQIKQPVFIWGAPGVGKSQVVKQVAQKQKPNKKKPFTLIDVRAVLLDPVDLRGLPHINGDNMAHWCPPAFLPHDSSSCGILFLDELNAAPPLTQAACYQLVLDRKLGEYTLPDGWMVIAAGNRENDKAVVHRIPSALANRFVHLNFEVDINDWVRWAMQNNIKTEVIAFLRYRTNLLHSFDPKKSDEKAFPSPRSWEFVSNILSTSPSKDIEFELIKGTVGEAAAAEFIGFLRICRKIPSPDAILMNPTKAEISNDPAVNYAICGALASRATEQTFGRIVEYLNRMPDEFSVLGIRDCTMGKPELYDTKAYIDWAVKHESVML